MKTAGTGMMLRWTHVNGGQVEEIVSLLPDACPRRRDKLPLI